MSKDSKSDLLSRGLRPKKSFGQNFMIDQAVNERFARAVSALSPGGIHQVQVIEIGAGVGSLTYHLLKVASVVHAVERDRDLVPILREKFSPMLEQGRVVVHEADGARFAIDSIFGEDAKGILVGNLPYHLTSSIALLALKHQALLLGAVFLVQKEVADRLIASPGGKQYGFLTVILKLAFEVTKVCDVDRSAFWPVPKVDSSIVKLKANDRGISRVSDVQGLIAFVRQIFQKRRKKISTILSPTLSKDDLRSIGIDPDLRPETLHPEQFLRMFERAQKNQPI